MKKVIIGTTCYFDYLSAAKNVAEKLGYQVIVTNNNNQNMSIWDVSYNIANNVNQDPKTFGIIIEDYGNGGFIIASKFPHNIVAQLADEHSAHMTREHNNANIMVVGAEITGKGLFVEIVNNFLSTAFAAGRHLVRTDMLTSLLIKEEQK